MNQQETTYCSVLVIVRKAGNLAETNFTKRAGKGGVINWTSAYIQAVATLSSMPTSPTRQRQQQLGTPSLQIRRRSCVGFTQSSESSSSRIPVNEYTYLHKFKH